MAKAKKQVKKQAKQAAKVVPINSAVKQALGKFAKGLECKGTEYGLRGGPLNGVVGRVRIKGDGFAFRMRVRQPASAVKQVLGKHAKDWEKAGKKFYRFVGEPKGLAKQVEAMLETLVTARQSKTA